MKASAIQATTMLFVLGVQAMVLDVPAPHTPLLHSRHKSNSSTSNHHKSNSSISNNHKSNSSTSNNHKSNYTKTITALPVQTSMPPAQGGLPAHSGTTPLPAAQTIAAGESFDGKMAMYDRGVSCEGQKEGGDEDAVFNLEEGATLSNVIIGPNQMEGVHCQGACTLNNVWWSAVCEDAFTVKVQDDSATTYVKGGGAFGAHDKVVQHNGGGTVSISGFLVENFGKLYRSCGDCKKQVARHVILENIDASDGTTLVGINTNYGDTAELKKITAKNVDDICTKFTGNDEDEQPEQNGSGPDSKYCLYSESDITSS